MLYELTGVKTGVRRWRSWTVVLAIAGVLGLGMGAPGLAQRAAGESSMVTLAQLRDRFRPLLIFAPTAQDARLLEQVRVVNEHPQEAADRQLVTVAVAEQGEVPAGRRLAEADVAEARRRFHVGAGEFAVVLVGKDGGEKLRAAKPFSFEKVRDVIDAMPMRRDEMKGQGK